MFLNYDKYSFALTLASVSSLLHTGGELKRFSVLCGIARGSSILILDEVCLGDSIAA